MVQIYYKEHHGNRHYTFVWRKSKLMLNGYGIQLWDMTCGTDKVIVKIEDLSDIQLRLQQICVFPIGDWTLGKVCSRDEVPASVLRMAEKFEQAGLAYWKNHQIGDTLRKSYWKYAEC